MNDELEHLRFPIGRFAMPGNLGPAWRADALEDLARTPAAIRHAVRGLADAQLDTPYRPGGWTVRQVVHHLPDSHVNSYVRFKRALTEDEPLVCTYDEAAWAALPDSERPIDESLELLELLHRRWVALLKSLDEAAWQRTLRHPEWGTLRLEEQLAIYAWHGPHHVAHITSLRSREGW